MADALVEMIDDDRLQGVGCVCVGGTFCASGVAARINIHAEPPCPSSGSSERHGCWGLTKATTVKCLLWTKLSMINSVVEGTQLRGRECHNFI